MLKKNMIFYTAFALTSTAAIADKGSFSFMALDESANSAGWDAAAP